MKVKKFDMNLLSIVSLGIGSIIGAGIFALLGQVILLAGTHTYYAFIIAGVAALFSGYSYARLAGTYHDSGGLTKYFQVAFKSKLVSGGLSIIYVLTSAVSISMMSKSFGIYITELFDIIPPTEFWINCFAAALIFSLAFLNMMGAGDVGKVETLFVAIKVCTLTLLIIAAAFRPEFKISHQLIHPDNMDFLRSIGITFFAYAGYGVITNATGDVENPKKTIAEGIFLTLVIVTAIYLCLTYVVINYTPSNELTDNADTAVTIVAQKLMGKWGYAIMYIAAIIAFISGINATFFSIFRINFSLSQQKILPKIYHESLWRKGTYGNLLTTAIIFIATVSFDFSDIVNLSSAAYLVSYLGVFMANWVLRKETNSSPIMILLGLGLMLLILIAFIISLL